MNGSRLCGRVLCLWLGINQKFDDHCCLAPLPIQVSGLGWEGECRRETSSMVGNDVEGYLLSEGTSEREEKGCVLMKVRKMLV